MNSATHNTGAATPLAVASAERRYYEHTCACGCGGRLEVSAGHRSYRIPRFLPGHNAKTGFEQWAAENTGKHFCACGCGEPFNPTRQHRRDGFPRYKRGHATRVAHVVTTNVAGWVREQQGKHLCACGCGEPIKIHPPYRWEGIPKMRRVCFLRQRVLANHPNWKIDRSMAARSGRYFPPSVRRQILERDGYRCRCCGASDKLAADHIVPICEGGDGSVANGQTLCSKCHAAKTREERARRSERASQ